MKHPLFTLVCIFAALSMLLLAGGMAATAQEPSTNTPEAGFYAPLIMGGVHIKGASTCFNALTNSGFENDTGWEIPATAYSAAYSTARAHSGSRSMRTGITMPVDNRYSYSDARQVVSIPSGITSASLRLWVFPQTSESTLTSLAEINQGMPFGQSPMAGDVQYVIVLDRFGSWIDTLLWQRSNANQWVEHNFDLTRYAGQTIKIQFGTYNDGFGGISSMFVDDAFLETCTTAQQTPGPSPTPTVTPTTTQTPLPTPTVVPGCFEGIANGSFETLSAWEIPITEYSAGYSQAQVRTGSFAMRTGITNPADNRFSYSSTRQRVTIPSNVTSATLNFWLYPLSGETSTLALPEELPTIREGTYFGDEVMAGDVQYALILDSQYRWIATMVWQRSNARTWTQYSFSLADFAGQTIYVHIGTYNDGASGISAMYVDDVSLTLCTPTGATPTATPTTVPTPTATPSGACTNLFGNSTFEANANWQIPLTAYSANYSTAQFFSGARSMRTGIVVPADNRFSYSDAWQQVTIPPNISSATLRLKAYQLSGESSILSLPETLEGQTFGEAALAGDVQYVLILNRYGTWIDTLLWQRRDTRAWSEFIYNLYNYRGWTIRLQFGTYNDGLGGITSMYVDDMVLEVCP